MQQYYQLIEDLCKLQVINVGLPFSNTKIDAILGYTATQSSFKAILGLGILLLAKEHGYLKDNQPIIESTSGSLGVALSWAGKMLNHKVYLVADSGCNPFTLKKMQLMGANIIMAKEGTFNGGAQEAREVTLLEQLEIIPNLYNVNQHHNPLNPMVYRRWLIPYLQKNINFNNIKAGIFCVGTGGHFIGLAEMLQQHNIPAYVAEREGSITFGGQPKPSIVRGAGNMFYVPKVIESNKHLVADKVIVKDSETLEGLKELSAMNIVVGGTSGMCYAGAKKLLTDSKLPDNNKKILTFFADKGELYWESLYKNL